MLYPRRVSLHDASRLLIGIQAALCIIVGLAALALNLGMVMVGGALAGFLIYLALFFLYARGFDQARHLTVAATSLLTGTVILLDHTVASGFTPAFFVPSVLALILTGPLTIGLSGLVMVAFVVFGLPTPNPYVEPVRLVMVALVVGGMMLARTVLDSMHQSAEEAAREARQSQERAEAEAAVARAQSAELAARGEEQRRLLDLVADLETPAVTVQDGVLLAPIIGAMDSRRANRIGTRLLASVSEQRARLLIIDLAGMGIMDTEVAGALGRLVASVRLLGCKVIITGISAEAALTITQLGVVFREIATARSPQEALEQHSLGELAGHRRN